jgi:hypothetical protein
MRETPEVDQQTCHADSTEDYTYKCLSERDP